MLILCFLAICGTVSASIKGLYCQDPDSGKLHPVNSTWPSTTFCGNYTCKLRKKNITETEYTPITKINVTEKHIKEINDMTPSLSENKEVVLKKNGTKIYPGFDKSLNKKVNISDQIKNSFNDRYLTKGEIKSITEILHTIKKSDLDAIVEIYNIAQDVFKESNRTSPPNKVIETLSILKQNTTQVKKKTPNDDKSLSYWYEPLHKSNHNENIKKIDTKPAIIHRPYPYPYPLSHFQGTKLDKEYGKVPYYYPISNFQRLASYIYTRPHTATSSRPNPKHATIFPMAPPKRPCSTPIPRFFPSPWYDPSMMKPHYMRPLYAGDKAPMQPMLLPYPFSFIHHYNYSYPSTYYYNNYPWAQLDSYYQNPSSTYYGYGPQSPIAEEIKKEEDVSKEIDIQTSNESGEDKELSEWQTKPLSTRILEEVKANIKDKSKLLKHKRKNIKLERVGKVIKLDEIVRDKRHVLKDSKTTYVDEDRIFEAYLEKTTCQASTELGFFRLGNLTAPYPNCCPQKIQNRADQMN